MPAIKRYPADKLFSTYIRSRDNWTCVRCRHQHQEKSQGLHCSHFIRRGVWATRFDPENCDALCFACHLLWGGDFREEYREFKKKQLGEDGYWALMRRSDEKVRRDPKKALEDVKKLVERGV